MLLYSFNLHHICSYPKKKNVANDNFSFQHQYLENYCFHKEIFTETRKSQKCFFVCPRFHRNSLSVDLWVSPNTIFVRTWNHHYFFQFKGAWTTYSNVAFLYAYVPTLLIAMYNFFNTTAKVLYDNDSVSNIDTF